MRDIWDGKRREMGREMGRRDGKRGRTDTGGESAVDGVGGDGICVCGWGYGCGILNRFGGEGLDFHDRSLVVVGIWGWRVMVRWRLILFDLLRSAFVVLNL